MTDVLRQSYAKVRRTTAPAHPIVYLHIGDAQTSLASGTGAEPAQVLALNIGAVRTAADFFKHRPPSPLEIETAIMVVEDEVSRARAVIPTGALLYSTDERLHAMATMVSGSQAVTSALTIEDVEGLFNQLAARAEGRPASQVDPPEDPQFAAALLILREFMHHLQFDRIRLQRGP